LCSGDLDPPTGEFTAVTAGFYFQCGLRTNAEIACWGSLTGRDAPLVPPAGKFALIDAGWQHACAVRTDGVTVCWGANESGQSTPPSDFP
jgi:alpha-tubulin suppressor-like RCC1 family protein